MRRRFANLPIVKFFTNVKIMVVCLILLFILTLWGTIYQVEFGLYPAQQRFFQSFFFPVLGFIPFPGAQLVMWVMFVNLMFVAAFRFVYRLDRIGIAIIHFGFLLFLVSAFVTFHCIQESHLTLYEGEGSNVSSSYNSWELAVWKNEADGKRKVVSYDAKDLASDRALDFDKFGFNVRVKSYFPNCQAYDSNDSTSNSTHNSSGIASITALTTSLDPDKNMPGGIFTLEEGSGSKTDALLFGGDLSATVLDVGGQTYSFMLRHKRYVLPFTVTLKKFHMEFHPGTQVARTYESTVDLESPEMTRQTVIYMNNPLRYKNYTFYQASYNIDSQGRQSSTLAVVRNSGRLLPYVSSITTVIGLLVHFLLMFSRYLRKERMSK